MNYLFAGEAIKRQLMVAVPEFKEVLLAGELAKINRAAQKSPSAYVIYEGDVINSSVQAHGTLGKTQYITQRWTVAIVVHLADKRSLNSADNFAGELMTRTLQALSGFIINERTKPLTRATVSRKAEYIDGWGYYPYVFNVEFIMPRAK
ncbi:phage tail terminator protein [Actinobacillus pleuropneumoniae]|uniref:phage tail terminator protein n=1 Tax=Actinobacillus pleuropneumoniae TaxID=715 RepID=UPI003B01399C